VLFYSDAFPLTDTHLACYNCNYYNLSSSERIVMKPLELLKIAMTALVCGSIFLAAHLFPLMSQIVGSILFVGGLALTIWVVRGLIRARKTAQWQRVFGRSHPTPGEIAAWRSYTEKLSGKSKPVNPWASQFAHRATQARINPASLFFHSTVPHSDIPRRRSRGPLTDGQNDQSRTIYWTMQKTMD
jgi:hypothetical protein